MENHGELDDSFDCNGHCIWLRPEGVDIHIGSEEAGKAREIRKPLQT